MSSQPIKRPIRRFVGISMLFAFVSVFALTSVRSVYASVYGGNNYGNCKYSECASSTSPGASTSTTVTTPTGLEVSLNVTDGQEIPYNGYTILVTPLNGTGSSFKEVRFYLEGLLVQTVVPDATGTAQWWWDPQIAPGTHLKIDVVDTDGTTTSHSFTVRIASKPIDGGVATPTDRESGSSSTSGDGAGGGVLQRVYDQLKDTVATLPGPVVEVFPYFLFMLLGINVFILFLQFHREVKEYYTTRMVLDRAKLLAEQKQTFIALVSHYLRTPLTVLAGGVEMLKESKVSSSQPAVAAQAIVTRIGDKIEQLLRQTKELVSVPDIPKVYDDHIVTTPFWKRPGLYVPLLLIGVLLAGFNAAVLDAGKFSHAQLQVATQAIIFIGMVLATYQLFRRRQLRLRDRQLLQPLVEQEVAMATSRDALMAQAVAALSADVGELESIKQNLATASGGKYITEGIEHLQTVLAQFAMAESLKGIHASGLAQVVPVSNLLDDVCATKTTDIENRKLTIALLHDSNVAIANPELLKQVLASVLDNAVVYSHAKGTISVDAEADSTGMSLSVHDDGSGISPEKAALLFQPFYRVEGAYDFNHAGMGFSLYLCKLILTYLGGDISIKSEPGHGTTVAMQLPATA